MKWVTKLFFTYEPEGKDRVYASVELSIFLTENRITEWRLLSYRNGIIEIIYLIKEKGE